MKRCWKFDGFLLLHCRPLAPRNTVINAGCCSFFWIFVSVDIYRNIHHLPFDDVQTLEREEFGTLIQLLLMTVYYRID